MPAFARCTALTLVGISAAAHAEPPADDWKLTLKARQALWADPQLREQVVGVQVRDGVASVWGVAPSPEVASAVCRAVGRVGGIRSVTDELTLPPPKPVAKSVVPPPTQSLYPKVMESSGLPIPLPATPPRRDLPVPVTGTLAERIEAIRVAERRYAAVQCQIQAGHVSIGGTVRDARDGWDFATAVRALPGVSGVSQNTRVRSPGD